MAGDERIDDADWRTIVRTVPIVSVDLVVRHGDAVLLGRRTNEPAAGEWFVPGGRVHKNERLADAVHRIAGEEVGTAVTIERQLGVYEHFWETAAVAADLEKHYVPVAYLVTADGIPIDPDDQHDRVRWFEPPFDDLDLHHYVATYLEDAGILSGSS